MAKDTFFLRTTLTTSAQTYVSDDIDISAYTDPARGRVLVVDKAFITFGTDGNGPIVPADVTAAGSTDAKNITREHVERRHVVKNKLHYKKFLTIVYLLDLTFMPLQVCKKSLQERLEALHYLCYPFKIL